ncbi:hypothetical protein H0H87_012582 [Tephrocybe sp. NHM501043]|nr:hypothetical protein H0H87_012582 [Tephrocybe sp. NHM501043]
MFATTTDAPAVLPKQPSPPPSPPNTISYDDDDDDTICPVCDGECTCANKPQPQAQAQPPLPLSMSQLSALHAPTPPRVPSPPKPLLPSLKIKLSLSKRRDPDPDVSVPQQQQLLQPKRRGRPPKAAPTTRQPDPRSHAATTLTKQKKPSTRPPAKPARPPLKKSATATAKRRRVVSSDDSSSSSSDLSDVDHLYSFATHPDDDDDVTQFPTFVSASAISSRASSSSADSSSDLSSFDDSDSSIEAEEEKFIMSEMQGRARVRRELLGDDAPKKRDSSNAWVIRPRKKSVGPSDVEMDVDTDATEDEEEEEEDDDAAELDEDEADEKGTGVGYVGVATGWSEDDDESSFDADLFFANLSDSEDHGASSTASDDGGDDGDHSDMESMEASITSLPAMPPEFEVLERWDGQIVFTNGLREGQGMLDMDFEAHAASLVETSSSPGQDSDVEMSDVDDGGYEEDADEGDGETTDEELVGDDDLPNERAMRLFNTPFSVSAINPMSTMSPAVSPGPRDRRPFRRSIDSPKPADILSGRVFWDSDDQDEFEESTTKSSSQVSSTGQGPRKGCFVPMRETRQAIIDDLHKDIPSPHPRFRRRKPSFASVEHLLQRHLASQTQPSLPCSPSPFHLVTPSVDKMITMSPEMANAELVDLNDVLEASFLDPEPPSDSQNISTDTESRRQIKSFNRWDIINVGAFRQRREGDVAGAGWGSDTTPGNKTDYGSMMKSSPLSTMLWQNKANNNHSINNNASSSSRRSRKMSVVISPVILPVRDRDGDRTPTNMPPPHRDQRHDNYNYPHKSRKELRRERKMKRKSYGTLHHPHQRHQHHNHHQHHPNLKSRTTSSSQRSFFSSSVPPLNL